MRWQERKRRPPKPRAVEADDGLIPEDQAATYPANARLQTVKFAGEDLLVAIEPGGERQIHCSDVRRLHGARIRRVSTSLTAAKGGANAMKMLGGLAVTLATGVPVVRRSGGKEAADRTKEEFQYVLGLRVSGVEALWYLINTSFNFRTALGPEAGYAAEVNLRTFVRKLAEVCSEAQRDDLFTAVCDGRSLPEPIDSLMEFFRSTQP